MEVPVPTKTPALRQGVFTGGLNACFMDAPIRFASHTAINENEPALMHVNEMAFFYRDCYTPPVHDT